ncbi:MAG: helix-turn-helix transcriptional regulator [Myxococcaceae bacterium]|nr:helix-turn-helix transcriptional regulator [Myxococcaceae bacterium]
MADEEFTAHGAEVSLDQIAKRAGVGIGTLYRHFPTRQDLLVATLADSMLALAKKAKELGAARSAGQALAEWIAAYVKHSSTYQGLSICLNTLPDGSDACSAVVEAGSTLLARAQAEGCVRLDVDFEDISAMATAVAFAAEDVGKTRRKRMLEVFIDGLKR